MTLAIGGHVPAWLAVVESDWVFHAVVWGFGIAIVLAIVARDAWKKRKRDRCDLYIADLRKSRALREANRGR